MSRHSNNPHRGDDEDDEDWQFDPDDFEAEESEDDGWDFDEDDFQDDDAKEPSKSDPVPDSEPEPEQDDDETEPASQEEPVEESGVAEDGEQEYATGKLEALESILLKDNSKGELLAQDSNNGDVYAGEWPRTMFEAGRDNPEQPLWIGYSKDRYGVHKEVPVEKSELDKHMAIYGRTGMGKSTLIKNILAQIAIGGAGFCYIDPKKGDDIFELLQMLPEERLDDVIWIEPAARGRDSVVGLNFLEPPVDPGEPGYEEAIEATVSNLVGILRAGDFWGARMDRIAKNIVRAMSQSETNYTLVDMYFILRDDERREKFADAVAEEGLDFVYEYTKEVAEMDKDNLEPLLGRMQPWVENSITREVIAHDESTIDLTKAMKNDKIILVKNTIASDDVKKALSTGIVRRFWSAAQERAENTTEAERDLYYLAIDESDDVLTPEMQVDKILTKARSYKLSLILLGQYPSQLSDEIQQALFANVNTILAMSVTENSDARTIMKRFEGKKPEDLINLDAYKAWTKIPVGGQQSKPFVTNTFADYPPRHAPDKARRAIENSLQQYGVPRKTDEDIRDSLNIPGETTADHESTEYKSRIIARATYIAEKGSTRTDDYAPVSLVKEITNLLEDFGEYNFSQVIENNPDVFETKRDGEMMVSLTEHGEKLAQTQDSGSSGSAGKGDHRYLLRRTREEFARIGIAVAVPEQGGGGPEVDGLGYVFNDQQHALLDGHDPENPVYIEAESTTLASRPAQTLRNLREAMKDDRKCIFVVKGPSDNPEKYARKLERIITERRGYRQLDNGNRLLYTLNNYLSAEKGGTAYPVRRRHGDGNASKETRWWLEDNELVLRDRKNREFARFKDIDAYVNHSIHDFPAYSKQEGGRIVVYQDGEQIASYDKESEFKNEWVRVKKPFVPDIEFPHPPQRDDYGIVIIPDNEEEALRYIDGQTAPLTAPQPTPEPEQEPENDDEDNLNEAAVEGMMENDGKPPDFKDERDTKKTSKRGGKRSGKRDSPEQDEPEQEPENDDDDEDEGEDGDPLDDLF